MMDNWAAVGAIAAIAGFGLAFATFWITFGSRISKAESEAAVATEQAKDIGDKLAIQIASFALFREQVAKEYIHREVMREVEDRLTVAIGDLGKRLDRFTEAALAAKSH